MDINQYRIKPNQKKNMQTITMYHYYTHILFPKLFATQNYPPSQSSKYRTVDRKIVYNYTYQICQGVEDLNHSLILEAIKNVYFYDSVVKIKQNTFFKSSTVKLQYLPISAQVKEQIDLLLLTQDYNYEQPQQNTLRKSKSAQYFASGQVKKENFVVTNKDLSNQVKHEKDLFLYVIHYSQPSNDSNGHNLQWQNFIQRFKFSFDHQAEESRPVITHQVVFVFNSQNCILSFDQSHRLLQNYFDTYFSNGKDPKNYGVLQKLQKTLRSMILQQKSANKIQIQSASFDISHRRELQLKSQHRPLFAKMRDKAVQYFKQINKNRELNKYFLQNMVCRMMQNENFKDQNSWNSIKYYLDFQKKMRNKYRWSDFEKYNKMNVFTYIGKDMMGRPILLNRLRNVLCSKISDFDQFFDYHFYLFQIYLQDQMEGWVDQFSVIADVSNQINDNTNIGFTKRIIFQGFKLVLGRHHKIIPFDIGLLGYSVYRILKGIMPDSFVECVKIFGSDRNELLAELRTFISDDVIPEFLGGHNPTIETRPEKEERTDMKNTQITSERSFIPDSSRGRRR